MRSKRLNLQSLRPLFLKNNLLLFLILFFLYSFAKKKGVMAIALLSVPIGFFACRGFNEGAGALLKRAQTDDGPKSIAYRVMGIASAIIGFMAFITGLKAVFVTIANVATLVLPPVAAALITIAIPLLLLSAIILIEPLAKQVIIPAAMWLNLDYVQYISCE